MGATWAQWSDAIVDCTSAVAVDPDYVKAFLRRATAYEESDDLEHSYSDYQKVCHPFHGCLFGCLWFLEAITFDLDGRKIAGRMFGPVVNTKNMAICCNRYKQLTSLILGRHKTCCCEDDMA